jgi:hypothetical protein
MGRDGWPANSLSKDCKDGNTAACIWEHCMHPAHEGMVFVSGKWKKP